MKKTLLLFILCCCLLFQAFAQSAIIHGKVADTSSGENLKNATVLLLEAKDSMLQSFSRINADGKFTLKNIDTGRYIVLVTYPQYADYAQDIYIAGKDTAVDLGNINLIQMAHLLKDVIVSQKISAIRIKGDTTEFTADSFKVQPNASVEDLLKKLPGIQVDKDGKITAQGQTVQKVLVDGEEFFGDDPTLVTKNLRADMVDKVQLYDKSSDQAAFTGIDDGNKQKTLNLKLKENKKNGYFGKLSGGLGTDKYKETQDMFNYFKGKMKASAYMTLGNTGKTGLGFQDEQKYGVSGMSMSVGATGNMNYNWDDGVSDPLDALQSWNGNYDGKGIPDAKTGGVHYDTKWNNDKQGVNLNYKIGAIGETGNSQSITQNNLDSGVLFNYSNNNFYNHVFRNKLDGIYNLQLDSTSSVKITAGGSTGNTEADSYTHDSTTRLKDSLVNKGYSSSVYKGNTKAFNVSLLWQKKFKKKGRTISLNMNDYIKNKDDNGFISNHHDFYNNQGEQDSTYNLDQMKTKKNAQNSFNANLTYTEPLNKYLYAAISYGLFIDNATSDIKSYNKDGDDSYDLIDSLYSNHYIYNQTTNTGGLSFIYNKGKLNFNFGTNIGSSKYNQTNTFKNPQENLKRSFVNWNPNARLSYKFSQTKGLYFNYYGSTQQPSITQIQPVLDNTNPLNVAIGNPYLKPSFSNRFNLQYNSYKVLSQQGLFFWGTYGFTANPIVSNITTDQKTGASTYTYINTSTATSNFNVDIDLNKKIKKLDINAGIDISASGNKYLSYVNNAANTTNSNTYSFGVFAGKYKENVIDASFRGSVNYNTNHYSLQSQINNNYWSYNLRPDFDFFLPKKFQIHTDGNYQWNQATQSAPVYHQFIWNAWIGKKFFKKDNLLLKFSCNDILNQNNGFSRYPNSNGGFQQTINSTIKRYFMFSVVWNFEKMGGISDKK